MITDMMILEVPHPVPDQLPKGTKLTYIALTWNSTNSRSALNIDYAEDTLKQYCLGKEITNLEYFEALKMVKDYKKSLTK